jgi:hypothetical protein
MIPGRRTDDGQAQQIASERGLGREHQLGKHLAQAAVPRRLGHHGLAIRLAVGAGAAVLAVGFAPLTVASSTQEPAPAAAAVVSAPADARVFYTRSVVVTGTTEGNGKLNLASAERRRPVPGTLMAPLAELVPSSPYGLRTNPITGEAREFHWGQDFSASCGTRVHSADAGVVREVGWHQWGGGNRVEVDHGNGLITSYNHLEGIAVRKGQPVHAGEVIANVGTTGASTGCHLHLETILNGSLTDPAKWTLPPLRQDEPAGDITMTDYQAAGSSTAVPAWAVQVTQTHDHEGDKGGGSAPDPAPFPFAGAGCCAGPDRGAAPFAHRGSAPFAHWGPGSFTHRDRNSGACQ